MILWTIKLFTTFRRAIAGRRYPHQLAWAVAFGLLLGIIPHGNLLAVGLVMLVLSLKLNHAAAGLTAIATSFLAARLDPVSHEVGDYVLTHPQFSEVAVKAWSLPLVAWTDLNNTVVMGSFVIGSGALLPVFFVTYPIFKVFRPKDDPSEIMDEVVELDVDRQTELDPIDTSPIALIDHGHSSVSPPHQHGGRGQQRELLADREPDASGVKSDANIGANRDQIDFVEVADPVSGKVAVETRVDVIRIAEGASAAAPHVGSTSVQRVNASSSKLDEHQPMDEALNYLLRQLRDSQTRKSA